MIHYISNARLLSEGKHLSATSLTIEGGRITAIGAEVPQGANVQHIDLKGQYLSPGFIDIQLNGGYTNYFSLTPTVETLTEMSNACIEFATPFFYPTLITSPLDVIYTAIDATREAMKTNPHILGMHLEGPFLNPKRRGAHNIEWIQEGTPEIIREIVRRGEGVIKLITVAPETLSEEALNILLESGIQVSAGHSDATYEEAKSAFDKGVNIVTHLYNAMPPFGHRTPGLIGAALEDNRVYTPLILDGRHSVWGAARLAHRAKKDKFLLITDSTVLGRRLKRVAWPGLQSTLTEDGFYYNDEGNLSGGAISLVEAVQNAMKYLDVTLSEAVDMASGRPAKAIGRSADLGRLAVGYTAAFSVFNEDLSSYSTLSFI